MTRQYQGFDLDEALYSEALDVDGDTILEQTEMSYDAAGNLIQTTMRQRYHNATGTGELGSPGRAQPKARVSYPAQWHDPVGRVVATAGYGTNGGTALSRPSTVPADPTALFSAVYDAWNRLVKVSYSGTSNTVQENCYDGRRFRIARKEFAGDVLDKTRHFFHSQNGQAIEERVDTSM